MNYLSGSTRPDIVMAVHQTDRFCIDPRRSHEKVVMWIARCLRCTARFGMHCKLDASRGVEVFVDAWFAGNWSKENFLDLNYVL